MGRDMILKQYLSDNERYADLINGIIFKGKPVLQAEDLTELDSQTGVSRVSGASRNRKAEGKKPRYRDLIRKAAFGMNFAVAGVENQEQVHYLMPLRTMSYDVEEYEKQASAIRKTVKRKKGITKSEFLSGFLKTQRLHPCITLVLYYGEHWDGSRDLHGILDFTDIPEELKAMVNNYFINLIEVRKLENTEVFQTDLKQVFDFIRCSRDKKKLKELVQNDEAYSKLEEDAFDVATSFTNSHELAGVKKYHEKGGKVDMCEALTGLIEDGRMEGFTAGRNEGFTAGRNEGFTAGRNEGFTAGKSVGVTVGRIRGREESENNIKRLYFYIKKDNRMEDFARAMESTEYLQKLYQEYGIK